MTNTPTKLHLPFLYLLIRAFSFHSRFYRINKSLGSIKSALILWQLFDARSRLLSKEEINITACKLSHWMGPKNNRRLRKNVRSQGPEKIVPARRRQKKPSRPSNSPWASWIMNEGWDITARNLSEPRLAKWYYTHHPPAQRTGRLREHLAYLLVSFCCYVIRHWHCLTAVLLLLSLRRLARLTTVHGKRLDDGKNDRS